ncbi:MAG TPA: DUF6350 family protein [Streptosporangiaceae bacterium]|nr:DUF6350 family protein [Streptosporangiaceae bacterium]
MTTSALGTQHSGAAQDSAAGAGNQAGGEPGQSSGATRPLVVTGAIAAAAAAGTGLVALTMLVLAGWIAAPHAGIGLTGVLRTAAALWLVGHHVGFTLHGAGRIGMLPLGLVLLPGALLWRAGRWVVAAGGVARLRHVGYAALALAVPYSLVAGALALTSASRLAVPSAPQAVAAGFLLALTAGGLGGARALAPWRQLAGLLSVRFRSVILGSTGALAILAMAGCVLAGASLAAHLGEFRSVNATLAPGIVGAILLMLAQLAYVPNAVIWAISFMLGPGFAFGTGTVVAPTGSALGSLPALPMLAGLPAGMHSALPAWLSVAVLALPYLAGVFGGLLTARAGPTSALEAAPLWGFASGALTGCVTGALAAFAGGPLGDGRLSVVGPSGWQVGAVATLEVGVAAAVTAGVANWLSLRRMAADRTVTGLAGAGHPWPGHPRPGRAAGLPGVHQSPGLIMTAGDDGGHTIYLDRWAGEGETGTGRGSTTADHGPSALP